MSRFTKPFLCFLILAFALSVFACSGGPSIKLSKDWVLPAKTIEVKYKVPSDMLKKDGWIGVVPADTPDEAKVAHNNPDLFYKALEGKNSGKFSMTVPRGLKDFELRIYSSEENGKVLARAPFKVTNELRR